MPRSVRVVPGGIVFHVLNRANGRLTLFHKPQDYTAFEKIMAEALRRHPTRLLAYCLMPNHWHMALWPRRDGEVSALLHWLTLTHSQRVHAHRHSVGGGHVYQGRFKSFPVQEDEHCLAMLRYIERNALRANLVKRAQDWRWSSLWRRTRRGEDDIPLSDWPIERPADWVRRVNLPQNQAEEAALRRAVMRGTPFGSESWTLRTARRLSLQSTLNPRGRPRSAATEEKGS